MHIKSEFESQQLQKLDEISNKIDMLSKATTVCNSYGLISREELAKRLKVTVRCIINYEKKHRLKPLRLGSIIRYSWEEVIKSMNKNQL